MRAEKEEAEKIGIQLTHRDLALMRWMNQVGFVTINHIASWLNVSKATAYARMKKLVIHHYLIYQRIFFGAPGIYRLNTHGVQISGSELPVLCRIPLSTYYHDLMVTTLSLCLAKRYQATYTPERALRHQLGKTGIGQFGHTPDGVLHLENKRIAIELELNRKGKRRREKIFQTYLKNFDYQEVWYFCSNETIERQITPLIDRASFIKTYQLDEFLQHE